MTNAGKKKTGGTLARGNWERKGRSTVPWERGTDRQHEGGLEKGR